MSRQRQEDMEELDGVHPQERNAGGKGQIPRAPERFHETQRDHVRTGLHVQNALHAKAAEDLQVSFADPILSLLI